MKRTLECPLTERPRQDGFLNIPAEYLDFFPKRSSTTPIRVYFGSAAHSVPRNFRRAPDHRIFGLTDWYRDTAAKSGDRVSIEVIRRGVYRMRLVHGLRLGLITLKTRHDKVVRILYELCKPSYRETYADHISDPNYKIIPIHSGYKLDTPETYQYRPDLWCRRKNGKIDVFEVWDSQTKEASEIDILLSALTQDVSSLSIVCFDEESRDLARKLSKVILTSIYNKSGEPLLSHQDVVPWIVMIPHEMQTDANQIRNFLRDKLKFG